MSTKPNARDIEGGELPMWMEFAPALVGLDMFEWVKGSMTCNPKINSVPFKKFPPGMVKFGEPEWNADGSWTITLTFSPDGNGHGLCVRGDS